LEDEHDNVLHNIEYALEKRNYQDEITALNELREELQQYRVRHNLAATRRERIVTVKTVKGMGIVVPQELYRPLSGWSQSQLLPRAKEALLVSDRKLLTAC
jgi:hypothetical protein